MSITNRKEREKEQRRRLIIESAVRLFAIDGYHNTSLDRVAEEAEISKGMIYLYFDNKEDLFFSILKVKFDDFLKLLEKRVSKTASLNELVLKIVNNGLSYSREHRAFFRLFLSEQGKFSDHCNNGLRIGFMNQYKIYLATVEKYLEKFIHNAELSRSVSLIIIGSINAHVMTEFLTNEKMDLEIVENRISNIILNGLNQEI